ncbi:5719_t:CDS:1, partial [Cetraspora pellucida]
MSLENLLEAEDHEELYQQFNKKDFVQTATKLEQVKDEVVISSLTRKKQLNILYSVLKIVYKRIDN